MGNKGSSMNPIVKTILEMGRIMSCGRARMRGYVCDTADGTLLLGTCFVSTLPAKVRDPVLSTRYADALDIHANPACLKVMRSPMRIETRRTTGLGCSCQNLSLREFALSAYLPTLRGQVRTSRFQHTPYFQMTISTAPVIRPRLERNTIRKREARFLVQWAASECAAASR